MEKEEGIQRVGEEGVRSKERREREVRREGRHIKTEM